MKTLVANYAFNKTAKTVTFSDYGSISLELVLMPSPPRCPSSPKTAPAAQVPLTIDFLRPRRTAGQPPRSGTRSVCG